MNEIPSWRVLGEPFYRVSLFYRQEFGHSVRKICVDAGLSCPNRGLSGEQQGCIFCNNESFSPVRRNLAAKKELKSIPCQIETQIETQIEAQIRRLGSRFPTTQLPATQSPRPQYLVYFQPSTNTNAPVPKLRKMYEEAIAFSDVLGIIIGTRPDAVPEPVLDLLEELSRKTWLLLEIGLQTIHNTTLRFLNRGHTYETFFDTVQRIAARGIRLGVHLILGLPGESDEQLKETATEISRLPIHSVKLHNLYICENTSLAEMYRQGRIKLPTRDEYSRFVVDFLERQSMKTVVDRIVSDVGDGFLIAPNWMREKTGHKTIVLQNVIQEFHRRDSYQGKLFYQRETPPKIK